MFVGYGGVVARDRVAAESDVFLRTPSLAAILPLAAGHEGLGICREELPMNRSISRALGRRWRQN